MIVYVVVVVVWFFSLLIPFISYADDKDIDEGKFFLGVLCCVVLLCAAIGVTWKVRSYMEVERYVGINHDAKAWIRERTKGIGNLTRDGVDAMLESEIAKLSRLVNDRDDPEDVAALANAKALLERERRELKRIREEKSDKTKEEEKSGKTENEEADCPGEFTS